MAVIKGNARQSTSESVSEGADVYLKLLRDGTMSVADVVAAWSLEGRVFTANAGTATTPITFGAGDIDTTEFDLHVAANTGTMVIPLSIILHMEAYGTTDLFEYMAVAGSGSTVGAGTAVTPVCTNSQISTGSACTVTAAATATSGVAITGAEFWRGGSQKTVTRATVTEALQDPMTFKWSWKEDGVLRIAPQIGVFASAQAGTGFIVLTYAQIATARVN